MTNTQIGMTDEEAIAWFTDPANHGPLGEVYTFAKPEDIKLPVGSRMVVTPIVGGKLQHDKTYEMPVS